MDQLLKLIAAKSEYWFLQRYAVWGWRSRWHAMCQSLGVRRVEVVKFQVNLRESEQDIASAVVAKSSFG